MKLGPSHHRYRNRKRGFTLLEVILALAIFVGAIAVLSRLLVVGVENAETAQWQSQAWLIAESRWSELESGIRTLNDSGPYEVEEMPGWQWSMQATSSNLPALYNVTLIVECVTNGPGMGTRIQLSRLYFDDTSSTSTSDSSSTGSSSSSSGGSP
jgi:type II secretion system protein I